MFVDLEVMKFGFRCWQLHTVSAVEDGSLKVIDSVGETLKGIEQIGMRRM